jgi:hypothetical protein
MQRIVAGITTLEQHLEMVKGKREVYRPPSCPHCGIKLLCQHGYYYRKADRRVQRPSLNPVPICRYRCGGCRRTCSRLPECIAPRRWYDWSVQQNSLSARLDGLPVGGGGDDGQPAVRSTARWWAWLQARGQIFAFSLRCRFRELGRASDFTGFWRQVFATLGLPRAMAWLDREMSVP